jgi:hypothetical protein
MPAALQSKKNASSNSGETVRAPSFSACGKGHCDRERPEVRPGDLDDRRLGQRGEWTEQEAQGQRAHHRAGHSCDVV